MTTWNLVLTDEDFGTHPLHEWLGDAAAQTIVVCTAEVRRTAPASAPFAGWRITPDFVGPITELLLAELVLELPIGRVAGFTELDVLRLARLRRLGGLPGQDVESARRYRDKWLMKSTAHQAGITVPSICPIDSLVALRDGANAIGLPAVLKPRMATGGVGVRFMMDDAELFAVASAGGLSNLVLEQHIAAPEFHVDGLVRSGGTVIARSAETVSGTVLEPDDSRALSLTAAAGKLLATLGSPEHVLAFHAEFFLGADGTPLLGEIAIRPEATCAGAFEAATGINLYREHLRGQLDLESSC